MELRTSGATGWEGVRLLDRPRAVRVGDWPGDVGMRLERGVGGRGNQASKKWEGRGSGMAAPWGGVGKTVDKMVRDGSSDRDFGGGIEQGLGVGVFRGAGDLLGGSGFHDASALHDGDAGGEIAHDGHGM